jgi:hypothetical protein
MDTFTVRDADPVAVNHAGTIVVPYGGSVRIGFDADGYTHTYAVSDANDEPVSDGVLGTFDFTVCRLGGRELLSVRTDSDQNTDTKRDFVGNFVLHKGDTVQRDEFPDGKYEFRIFDQRQSHVATVYADSTDGGYTHTVSRIEWIGPRSLPYRTNARVTRASPA